MATVLSGAEKAKPKRTRLPHTRLTHSAFRRPLPCSFFDKTASDGSISGMKGALKQILTEVAHGIGQALVVSHDRPYVLPAEKSFPLDAASLRRDASKIARDLGSQFKK